MAGVQGDGHHHQDQIMKRKSINNENEEEGINNQHFVHKYSIIEREIINYFKTSQGSD